MKQRYYSLDVFRGATVAFMILVNNPGDWSHIYAPLEHSPWHGLTPTDLVFPFFLFAVGNALAFVMPRLQAAGPALFWKKIITRSALIFLIGLFLNWAPFFQWQNNHLAFVPWTWQSNGNLQGIRIFGVLQRIALCYLFAAIIAFYSRPRTALLAGTGLLLAYWVICLLGNAGDPYSFNGWFGTRIDRLILHEPHMYHGEMVNGKPVAFDPEGIASTLPAIAQVIIGYLAGFFICTERTAVQKSLPENVGLHPFYRTITRLFLASALLLLAGYFWSLFFPINKKIWSSSYVLFTSGIALMVLAALIYFIEVKKIKTPVFYFFDVFGKNALFIYALSNLIPQVMWLIRIPKGSNTEGMMLYTDVWALFYQKVCLLLPGPPENASLFFALCNVLLLWTIGYRLDKRKIYIKV